ncbi:MAG: phenylalanine--tRNA ligase subunit beta [Aeriscardovia sp.]|nr:phenylalanine--tRNA ligase subunit beta [Aeriscardovia sp.]
MTVIDLDWMKDYVEADPSASPQSIASAFTRMGFEEEKLSPAISGPLVVGHVLQCEPEDHKGHTIHFCKIDIGEKVEEIVCGAPNIAEGSWVVAALPGAVLAAGFAILPQPKYGHTSNGMCCSFRELGLKGSRQDGIILLDDLGEAGKIRPGQDAIPLLGIEGWKLEVEITPNRGYALCYRGMAREYSCAGGGAFRDPAASPSLPPLPEMGEKEIEVAPGLSELYNFFAARAFGDELSKDPEDGVFHRLAMSDVMAKTAAGAAASFATLEIGCPVEALDASKISFPLEVRRASSGEKIKISGRDLECGGQIVLSQKEDRKIVSLLGLGSASGLEAGDGCQSALFFSYALQPSYASRLSQGLKVSTDLSYRFERGVDSLAASPALRRALSLLPSCSAQGAAAFAREWEERVVEVDPCRVERLLGEKISASSMKEKLEGAGCEVEEKGPLFSVRVPSWRYDLRLPVDLASEAGRLEGYGSIPAAAPRNRAMASSSPLRRAERKVQDALAYFGADEVMSYPFVGEKDFSLLSESPSDLKLMKIANPLYDSRPYLRTDLLSTLLFTAASNARRGIEGVKVFETGRVFISKGGAWFSEAVPRGERLSDEKLAAIELSLPDQPCHAAAVFSGKGFENNWQKERDALDYRDALEALNRIQERLGVKFEIRQGRPDSVPGFNPQVFHPGRSCGVYLAGDLCGIAGEVSPKAVKDLGLFDHTAAIELDLDKISSASLPPFRASSPSPFPSVKQDFSFEPAAGMSCADLEGFIRAGAGELLEDLELFDVYRAEGEAPSLTFSVSFRSKEKTLDPQEITKIRDSIISIAQAAGARLKGNC